ncbi:NF-kappa-B inhibitor alpha-like isoform X1 [Biomphalaria glabrata]|uniref:NF-kappa-B inhibitor alpha-like n=1 Tax=Biomphalaria glabrata TaxID=6526 RepID=A1YSB5_BIOGL|nr:NF-kappa-B inhibitor alpha-like [Biomphalaria glabrata]XP_013061136.2 NF-kappa-B inhibitor alpha-like isoform X1 [Biomphalaria glabrata]XP_013061203.2 NF-kappa-B inhibitor alpha-like isoform X1 [Biomphalaria glabrata]ABL74452.1 NFkB inhibitor [Biomphalaria glabrata]
MFTDRDHLQIPPAHNSHMKSPATDSKMSSESYLDDRADSGLGSLVIHDSGFYSSLKETTDDLESTDSKADNFHKCTYQQIEEEDDQSERVDSGYELNEQSNSVDSLTDNFRNKKFFEEKVERHPSAIVIPMDQRIKLFEGDRDGDNKLHLSILNGDERLSLLLIRLAPHCNWLNYCNHLWQTPLHLAVLTNQPTVVRRLLCAGADATCQDKDGNTPLHIACREGYVDIVRYLLSPVQEEELCQNLYNIPYQRLLQDMSIRNYEGETCLHIAVRHSHIKIVSLLLVSGVDINVGDGKSGRTALHIASELNNVDIIKIILYRRDAEIDVRNYAGLTPVQLAYGRGHKASVNEFCRHGNYTKSDISLHDSSEEDEDMMIDSD